MINIGAAEKFIHTNFLARQNVKRNISDDRKTSFLIICMFISALLCFFVFLWIRIYIIQTGYQISRTYDLHEGLIQENKKLRIERTSLSSPSRIEEIAKNKLEMVIPDNTRMVVLKW